MAASGNGISATTAFHRPDMRRRDTWEEMFQRLLEYRFENGNWDVPNPYAMDPELGCWVAQQHMDYYAAKAGQRDSTFLTLARENKLNQVGFQWMEQIPTVFICEAERGESHFKSNTAWQQHPTLPKASADPRLLGIVSVDDSLERVRHLSSYVNHSSSEAHSDSAEAGDLPCVESRSAAPNARNSQEDSHPQMQTTSSSDGERYKNIQTLADVVEAMTALRSSNSEEKQCDENVTLSPPPAAIATLPSNRSISPASSTTSSSSPPLQFQTVAGSLTEIDLNPRDGPSLGFDQHFSRNIQTHQPHVRLLGDPSEHDVIVGGGKKGHNHRGNVRFRQLISEMIEEYWRGTRAEKSIILKAMVADVQKRGRFVRKDPLTGFYEDVGDFAAREMTSQAFRNSKGEGYSSSMKTKKERRAKEMITKKIQISKHLQNAIARSGSALVSFKEKT